MDDADIVLAGKAASQRLETLEKVGGEGQHEKARHRTERNVGGGRREKRAGLSWEVRSVVAS